MEADEELSGFKEIFDFVCLKTELSSPILYIGLFADTIDVAEVEAILNSVPKLGEALLKFALNSVAIRVLLIYLDPKQYELHCKTLDRVGTQINKVIGIGVRTSFVDITNRELSYSTIKGFLGSVNQLARKTGIKEVFEKDSILAVLDVYSTICINTQSA
jgi:hypothetical protein